MSSVALAGLLFVLLVLAGLAYQSIESARDRRRVPHAGRLIDLGNRRRVHAYCSGAGEPAVILEAGIAATSLSWSRVQLRVAEFTHVCSYDRAGLGWSDLADAHLSAMGHAEMLRSLLRTLPIAPPYVLVGHSYGSFVVRAFADKYRNEVAGIVLVDPIYPSEWMQPAPDVLRRLRGGVFLSRVGAMLARVGFVRLSLRLLTGGAPSAARGVSRLFGSEAAGVLARLVGEVQKLPSDTWPAVQALWSQPKCFTGMARHLAALPQSAREIDGCGDLGDIPLVVISAGRQTDATREEQRRLGALSSRGRQIIAPHAGHWVHLDDPHIVVEAVRSVVEIARSASRQRVVDRSA